MVVPGTPRAYRARSAFRWPVALLAAVGLVASATTARTQPSDLEVEIKRLVLDASRSLQSANAALFLGLIDRRSFDGYSMFRDDLRALTAHRRIASSVAVGVIEAGTEEGTATVDWLLELTPKLGPGPVERRHRTVRVTVRRYGKRWRIIDLAPIGFFVPGQRPD